jgi:hypothetical protein
MACCSLRIAARHLLASPNLAVLGLCTAFAPMHVSLLEFISEFQLESIHLREFGYCFARGGQPILGRERSSPPGARCLCLISFLRLRGDRV